MSFALPGLEPFAAHRTIRDRISGLASKSAPIAEFPVEVDPALVAELVRRFPNECPEPGADAHEAMLRRQGEQRVIRLLARITIDQHPKDFGGQDVRS